MPLHLIHPIDDKQKGSVEVSEMATPILLYLSCSLLTAKHSSLIIRLTNSSLTAFKRFCVPCKKPLIKKLYTVDNFDFNISANTFQKKRRITCQVKSACVSYPWVICMTELFHILTNALFSFLAGSDTLTVWRVIPGFISNENLSQRENLEGDSH